MASPRETKVQQARFTLLKDFLSLEAQKYKQVEKIANEMQRKGVLNILFDILQEICHKEYRKLAAGSNCRPRLVGLNEQLSVFSDSFKLIIAKMIDAIQEEYVSAQIASIYTNTVQENYKSCGNLKLAKDEIAKNFTTEIIDPDFGGTRTMKGKQKDHSITPPEIYLTEGSTKTPLKAGLEKTFSTQKSHTRNPGIESKAPSLNERNISQARNKSSCQNYGCANAVINYWKSLGFNEEFTRPKPATSSSQSTTKLKRIQSPSYKFGKQVRDLKKVKGNQVPGPGAYYEQSSFKGNVGVSFPKSARIDTSYKEVLPPPTAYDPSTDFVSK